MNECRGAIPTNATSTDERPLNDESIYERFHLLSMAEMWRAARVTTSAWMASYALGDAALFAPENAAWTSVEAASYTTVEAVSYAPEEAASYTSMKAASCTSVEIANTSVGAAS